MLRFSVVAPTLPAQYEFDEQLETLCLEAPRRRLLECQGRPGGGGHWQAVMPLGCCLGLPISLTTESGRAGIASVFGNVVHRCLLAS